MLTSSKQKQHISARVLTFRHQDTGYFHHTKDPCYNHPHFSLTFPTYLALATTNNFSISIILLFQEYYKMES